MGHSGDQRLTFTMMTTLVTILSDMKKYFSQKKTRRVKKEIN